MVTGIGSLQGGAEHPHRSATPLEAALMGSPVDPLGQPAHHGPSIFAQGSTEATRHREPVPGGATSPPHRHGPPLAQRSPETAAALPVKSQRGAGQLSHAFRPGGISGQQHPPASPGLPHQARQGISPPAGSKPLDSLGKGSWPARQPREGCDRGIPGHFETSEGRFDGAKPHPSHPRTATPQQPPEATLPTPTGLRRITAGTRRRRPGSCNPRERTLHEITHRQGRPASGDSTDVLNHRRSGPAARAASAVSRSSGK